MSSQMKFQTLFKFPGPSIPSLPCSQNTNNKLVPPIPYSSLLPNIPITPKVAKSNHCNVLQNKITNLNIPNINNMPIPPPPSVFDVVSPNKMSPTKAIVNKVISDDDTENAQIMTETELLKSIEMEKRNYILKTQKLSQLHNEYHIKLENLKKRLEILKQKSMIIQQNGKDEYRESLELILKEKQRVYDSYITTQSIRERDQEQLKVVEQQHRNLTAIVTSLNKQLMHVINQYQLLCNKQNEKSMVNGEYMKTEQFQPPDCSGAIGNNAQFQEMLNDNRILERQIKFLKHIIKKETKRHKFNAI